MQQGQGQSAQYAETLLYKSLISCKKVFWFIFFFSCLTNILTMFMPIYTMQILDRVVTSGSVDTLILLTIITFTATLVMIIIEGCRSLVLQKIGEWLEKKMSPELVLKALALTCINPNTSGSQLLRDLSTIRGFVSGPILIAIFDTPWAILFFILMMIINFKIAIIALIGIVILALLAFLSELTLGKKMKMVNELQTRNYMEIEMAFRNAEIVEAMGMGPAMVRMWDRKSALANEMQDQTNFINTLLGSVTKLMKIVLNTFILAGGIYFSLSTKQPVGGILACSMLMGRVMGPIDILIGSSKMITAAKASYARIQNILVAVKTRDNSMQLPTPMGQVSVDRLIYMPPSTPGRPTIKGISFDVQKGDCVGVIGPSGSGKSTLAKLMVGVWKPVSGVIKLDGADVYTWNRDHFGAHVGYCPQDIELFSTSVKSNIARLSDEIDVHMVVKAAKIAGVHEFILTLPNGYETILGPGGLVLSGGQKQRIALARAFYGDIKLLVLDEPNSNLDQLGEQALMSAIQYARQNGITVIFTTHKFNMIGITNKLLVMQDGLVSSYGETNQIVAQLQQNQAQAQASAAQAAQGQSQASAAQARQGQSQEQTQATQANQTATSEQKKEAAPL